MALFNHKYPYTDFHEINLDWIIAKIREVEHIVDDFKVVNKISFAGLWDIRKQYQAWTIVDTDSHTGYISIKPVPSGVSIDNTEYWVQVANYSELYADVQNRIVEIERRIDNITIPKHYTTAGSEPWEQGGNRYYVDCVNGDDTNDGSETAPFKSLDMVFNMANTTNTDVRANLLTAGQYPFNNFLFQGMTVHITAMVDGCEIISANELHGFVFYNSHINLQCTNGTVKFTISNPSTFTSHFENTAVTAINAEFVGKVNYYGGYCYFDTCKFTAPLTLFGCNGLLKSCTFCGQAGETPLTLSRSSHMCLSTSATFECDGTLAHLISMEQCSSINIINNTNPTVTNITTGSAIRAFGSMLLFGGGANFATYNAWLQAGTTQSFEGNGNIVVKGQTQELPA